MIRSMTKYILSVFLLIFIFGCGNSKHASDENTDKLPNVEESVLIERLDSLAHRRPDHFYTKFNSHYDDSEYSISFKTSIRMREDSALNALITYATIPIYNTMVTPDTLTLVDKRNKCYIQENVSYLKETFNVDFQHKNIEELILGLPIAWDSDLEYHQLDDPYNYVVSSFAEEEINEMEKHKDKVFIRYYLSEDTKTLNKTIINSPKDTTSITINYYDREMINNYSIPNEGDITVETPRDKIFISFKYNRTSVNEPKILYLVIPDSYEECE